MTIAKIDTHVDDAIDRLNAYLKDSTEFKKLLSVYPDRMQDLEDVAFDLLDKRNFEDGFGEQLDVLGRHVGEKRKGRSDADYVPALAVRILINTTHGDKARLRSVAKLRAGADRVTFTDIFPAKIIITIIGGIIANPSELVTDLEDTALGGVGLFIIAALQDPPFAFSELIATAADGETTAADMFEVTHSLADVQDDDILVIYEPDTDAREYEISKIGVSDFEVDPGTLTSPRSGISYDIRRISPNTGGFGGLLSSGTNGATTGPDIFDSAGATFQSNGVDTTHKVFAVGFGLFDIDSVPLETRILSASLLAAVGAGASSVEYYIVDATGGGFLAALLN